MWALSRARRGRRFGVLAGACGRPGRASLAAAAVAEAIGCSAEFLREHVDLELQWIRRGRKRFVPVVELEGWRRSNAEATL